MSQRKEYIEMLETRIQAAQTALDLLKEKRDEALQDLQHEEVDQLEQHLDNARVSLKAISETAEEAWTELKDGIDTLLHELGETLNKLLKK